MARQRKEQAEETRWEKANSPAPKISAPPLLKIPPTETESAESFEKFMKDEEEKRI